MYWFLLIPVLLSHVLLAAHFLRAGHWPLVIASLALPLLLVARRPWAARLVQVAQVLGALEWAHTLFSLVRLRMAIQEPWTRMALILGAVALLTLASAAAFRAPKLARAFGLTQPWRTPRRRTGP